MAFQANQQCSIDVGRARGEAAGGATSEARGEARGEATSGAAGGAMSEARSGAPSEAKIDPLSRDFDSLYVSTTTMIVKTNIVVDIDALYELLPVAELSTSIPSDTRGEKRIKQFIFDENFPPGTILCVKDEKSYRGINIKKSNVPKFSADLKHTFKPPVRIFATR